MTWQQALVSAAGVASSSAAIVAGVALTLFLLLGARVSKRQGQGQGQGEEYKGSAQVVPTADDTSPEAKSVPVKRASYLADDLVKLRDLLNEGSLTQEEYSLAKAILLSLK